MRAILMSIQSKWLCEILDGRKTVELRKRFPKNYRGWVYAYCTLGRPYLTYDYDYYEIGEDDYEPCKVYELHDTRGDWTYLNNKVACRFWVDNVEEVFVEGDNAGHYTYHTSSLNQEELLCKSCVNTEYLWAHLILLPKPLLAIHISKLEIFDKPKELKEFSVERYAEMPNGVFPCNEPITKAPQSWQYIYIEEVI